MSRPSDDVRLLTISNTVSDRLKSLPADYEAASALIASAAFQVGFTRIAAGLAQEMAGPKGDTYIHERFAPEQFDVLQLICREICQGTGGNGLGNGSSRGRFRFGRRT